MLLGTVLFLLAMECVARLAFLSPSLFSCSLSLAYLFQETEIMENLRAR